MNSPSDSEGEYVGTNSNSCAAGRSSIIGSGEDGSDEDKSGEGAKILTGHFIGLALFF